VLYLLGVFVGVHLNKSTTQKSAKKAKSLFAKAFAYNTVAVA